MKTMVIFLIAFLLVLTLPLISQEKKADKKSTYLVETMHTKEECLQALDAIKNSDKTLLDKISWGCGEGNHTGYMMVEASGDKDAVKDLPAEAKKDFKVYKLAKFTPEQIEEFHK